MPEPALVVENYSFWYKLPGGERSLALDDASFTIDKGEFVLILGMSGSGKSTLALNLVGVYPDYFGGWNAGRILVNHPQAGLINRRELDRGQRFKTVNMLFQNPEDQIVTLTVEEEIGFALENYLVPADEISARIDRALDLVGLVGFRDRSTLKLSGGEKQRVALAAMLAMEPSILILDEPTSNLDPVGTQEVLDSVDRVRERLDITMILVEHEVDEVFEKVDRLVLVDGKKVLGPFAPRQFLSEHGLDVRDRMGLWIPQAAEVGLHLRERGFPLPELPLTGDELVASVRGLESSPPAAAPATAPAPVTENQALVDVAAIGEVSEPDTTPTYGEAVIQVRDVGFSYPSKPDVLRGVNMEIRRNELLAIVGQNGSGKSTLAAQLNGLRRPSSGEVLVGGKPTTQYKFAHLAKRVAFIFQVPEKQFIRNTVYDELAHGLHALGLPDEEVRRKVEVFLENVRLSDRRDASPYMLSHGQKRRLSVACMVITDPDVVILDEPTFGQDYQQAERLMQLLRTLADNGAAVAFITHDMRLVAEFADRCVALCDGEAIFEGSPTQLFSSRDVLERTHLKPPPVFEFSAQLFGEPLLTTQEVQDRIEERLGGGLRARLS